MLPLPARFRLPPCAFDSYAADYADRDRDNVGFFMLIDAAEFYAADASYFTCYYFRCLLICHCRYGASSAERFSLPVDFCHRLLILRAMPLRFALSLMLMPMQR